jgi:hypothetical protein
VHARNIAAYLQASEERREANVKMEGHVNGIWDQIRHVENSLSQRLTLAETSQVGGGGGCVGPVLVGTVARGQD